MTHLSPEDLLDIAEGAREAPPHLETCAACRRELADVRSAMTSIAGVDVPEPSPLFWDHLSDRVSRAVAAEPIPPRRWRPSWRVAVPAAALAAAAALIVVAYAGRTLPNVGRTLPNVGRTFRSGIAAPPSNVASAPATAPAAEPPLAPDATAESSSLAFMVDLANDIDMDPFVAAGLAGEGAADHAVTHLSESELRALADLLAAEMAKGRVS